MRESETERSEGIRFGGSDFWGSSGDGGSLNGDARPSSGDGDRGSSVLSGVAGGRPDELIVTVGKEVEGDQVFVDYSEALVVRRVLRYSKRTEEGTILPSSSASACASVMTMVVNFGLDDDFFGRLP